MKWTNEERWDDIIEIEAQRSGVPANLIRAIIGQESAFRPNVYRVEAAISDQSSGLMQILLATAKAQGYTGPIGDYRMLSGLFDPATNIHYGTSYLAEQWNRAGGDIAGAISAYNGGWRPILGFGEVASRPMTICLARDTSGKCIQTRSVPAGQYSNQPYVNAVLANYAYFENKTQPTDSPTMPGDTTGVAPSPLRVADQSQSRTDRRSSSSPTRSLGTTVAQAIMAIVQWFNNLSSKR